MGTEYLTELSLPPSGEELKGMKVLSLLTKRIIVG
jgi:hypothetical protein